MCHQTVSLIARYLEQHGIATVVMGCARDIVERAGAARFWFSNFPLGHSAGKPFDIASQDSTLEGALALFDSAEVGGTTHVSEQRWSDSDAWEQDFWDISKLSKQQIQQLQQAHEQTRAAAAAIKSNSAQTNSAQKGK